MPIRSADIDFGVEAGQGGGRRARQRQMLQDYARSLKDMIPTTGLTLARVAQIIRGMRGATDTMDVHGPSKAGRIVSFLELYPYVFEIQGSGPNIKVFVAKAPEPSPTAARPAEAGGARSSSDQAPREGCHVPLELIQELQISK